MNQMKNFFIRKKNSIFAEEILNIADKYELDLSCLAVEVLEDKNITGDERKQMIKI